MLWLDRSQKKVSPPIHDRIMIQWAAWWSSRFSFSSSHLALCESGWSGWRHIDLRGASATTDYAWRRLIVTMLIVNIWEVAAVPQPWAEWDAVICHNVSEEISISQTLVGGGVRTGGWGQAEWLGVIPRKTKGEQGEQLVWGNHFREKRFVTPENVAVMN